MKRASTRLSFEREVKLNAGGAFNFESFRSIHRYLHKHA